MDLDRPHAKDVEWCTLVNEECEWDNCDGCINNPPILTKNEENLKYCEFTDTIYLKEPKVNIFVNIYNTIGKFRTEQDAKKVIDSYCLHRYQYDPYTLKQYPLFFMLKKTHGLVVPKEIYAKKDSVCVVVYEDTIYLIAPKSNN